MSAAKEPTVVHHITNTTVMIAITALPDNLPDRPGAYFDDADCARWLLLNVAALERQTLFGWGTH